MFSLVISVIAIMMVVFLALSTVYHADPEKLPEAIALFVGLFVISILTSVASRKIAMRKYKKIVERKKKEIKMLRDNEIKNYVINGLKKQDFLTNHVKDLLSVLKIGKMKREELEREILETYKKALDEGNYELITDLSSKG